MMKNLLTFLIAVLFTATAFSQVTTIGIIGTGSPNMNWDEDVDMTQDPADTAMWTMNVDLVTGDVKFRANDDWALNWGSTDFPMGTGTVGGDNIPVAGGNYDVTFNHVTGEYNFESTAVTYMTVGLIGDAANGWDEDIDMDQDPDNPNLWTISSIQLMDGGAKFRAEDDWAVNWGSPDFPSGTGIQDGDNIAVTAGNYRISFNSSTGGYSFIDLSQGSNTSIGIIGTGSPTMGWDEDVDMIQDPTDTAMWTLNVDLVSGDVKFRANDDWAMSWGSADFPMGIGELGGANIPVTGGNYDVTFNHVTGEYNFESSAPIYTTVGIIGTAVNGGWDEDIDMEQNPTNPNLWTIGNIDLMDGEAKFRAEDDWAVNWGSPDFPSGIGTIGGDNIIVTAGTYKINFNSATGEYSFENPIKIFNTIGIIGDAANGWDEDIDMNQDIVNADDWNIEAGLVDGGLKFRANNDWADNWGAPMFPVGNGTPGGDNIPVLAGNWAITFNATSSFYTFTPVSIGLIGDALVGAWDSDEDLNASGTMGNTWTGTFTAVQDGAVKFRKNDDWATNWGAIDFPMGTGTQDGDNIPITAGDWMVTFNSVTGEYSFSPSTSTNNILNASLINIFPNPAANELNIQIQAEQMQGAVDVTVFDLNGKAITTSSHNASSTISTNVSNLSAGMYFLQVRNERYVINKRFSVAK